MSSPTLGSSHIDFTVHKCESYNREKHALVGFDSLLRDASGSAIRPRRYAKWMYLHCTLPRQGDGVVVVPGWLTFHSVLS